MFRQLSTVVLVVLVVVSSLAVVTAQESKHAAGKSKSPPKELTVDLGTGVTLNMVLIPAGEFMMGSPDAEMGLGKWFIEGKARPEGSPGSKTSDPQRKITQHRVRTTKPFYLGKYQVTQEQWEAVMGNNPSHFKGPKNPVEQVNWHDCQKFFDKLNAKPYPGGGKFRLPTEAQWEYACRAGSTTKYCYGDDEDDVGCAHR